MARPEPLRVALAPSEHADLYTRASAEYAAAVPGWERVLLRDGVVGLVGGPATASLVRYLVGEVPRITARLGSVTRNANGKSRYSTKRARWRGWAA